jgi:hypothetical protein
MTDLVQRDVVAVVVGQPQQTMRCELQRCREVIGNLNKACQDKARHFARASVLTQIANQLLEFELRLSPHFGAADALLTVLTHIDSKLTASAARDVLEQLESLLIYSDDDGHLSGRLERERLCDELLRGGAELVWSDQFPRSEIELLCTEFAGAFERGSAVDDALRSRARARLRSVHKARLHCRRERNIDTLMRSTTMRWVTLLMVGLLGLMTALFHRVAWSSKGEVIAAFTAVVAGGVGASLSSCHKLREESLCRDEFRRYLYREIWGQAAFGLVAGLFVFAAVNSGLVSIVGLNAGQINWYQAATLGFLSGFSEPFFIGLFKRLSSVPARSAEKQGVAVTAAARDSKEPRALGRRASNARIAAVS